MDKKSFCAEEYYNSYSALKNQESSFIYHFSALLDLTRIVEELYKIKSILLLDEYDQPIMSNYERGYHEQMGDFFVNLYGSAMKGNPSILQALLIGVQRVVKESIFSQFNNPKVYTVLHKLYASCFGLTVAETLLSACGLELMLFLGMCITFRNSYKV